MRILVVILIVWGAVFSVPGCGWETCSFDEHTYNDLETGEVNAAWQVLIPGSVSDDAGGGYDGHLLNNSNAEDCKAAFYHFDEEPTQHMLPVLVANEPAPGQINGGGILVAERLLPMAENQGFMVPIEGDESWIELAEDPYGDPSISKWVGLALCENPNVSFELVFHLQICNTDDDAPGADMSEMSNRLW